MTACRCPILPGGPLEGLAEGSRALLVVEPDAFMRNYYVNGARQYVYPLADRFIWARHFAETVSPAYVAGGRSNKDAVLSLDFDLMDSLTQQIRSLLGTDTAYRIGAEYGITVTDGNGRLVAMADGVKGLARPDPNSRAGILQPHQRTKRTGFPGETSQADRQPQSASPQSRPGFYFQTHRFFGHRFAVADRLGAVFLRGFYR